MLISYKIFRFPIEFQPSLEDYSRTTHHLVESNGQQTSTNATSKHSFPCQHRNEQKINKIFNGLPFNRSFFSHLLNCWKPFSIMTLSNWNKTIQSDGSYRIFLTSQLTSAQKNLHPELAPSLHYGTVPTLRSSILIPLKKRRGIGIYIWDLVLWNMPFTNQWPSHYHQALVLSAFEEFFTYHC